MAYARTARSIASHPAWRRERGLARPLLFKVDHPRSIDRHIDYFGTGAGLPRPASDPCGEGLLDMLGEDGVPA